MIKGKVVIAASLVVVLTTTLFSGCEKKLKTASTDGYVQVYETTGTKSKLMSRNDDIKFGERDESSVNTAVTIDESKVNQEIEGFGGALTHASAYVLMQLDKESRTEILKSLFDEKDGAAFGMMRITIGSSDYTTYVDGELSDITLDDMPEGETDEKLENFNIDVDKKELIPVIKEILEINPDIEIVAAPWSAPAWMKESKHLYRGSLADEYEKTYADYLVKYLQAYKDEGINVKYISMENEPLVNNMKYPCMTMDEYQQARVVKYVGKKIEDKKIDTKILAYDHNYDSSICTTVDSYAEEILGDKDTVKYVAGIALHGYGQFEAAEDFAEGFKKYNEQYGTKSFLTEIAEGIWSRDFASNISYSLNNMIMTPINYGSSGAMYWNLVLYSDGTPAKTTNDCLGVVNVSKDDSSVSKNSAYYAMAHISKYVYTEDGFAKSIASESDNPNIVSAAFLRADGHVVEVLLNTSDKFADNVDVIYDEKSFTYQIQPQSVVTFIW